MEYICIYIHIYTHIYNVTGKYVNNGNDSVKAFQLATVIRTHRTPLCQMDSSNLENKKVY